ncbi:uncharacterized protein [Palaemon carinicauda]|uniref:uncharacterized protein n=1 Tax=Palaemon carinicauda TaxID=392227 RepID=UPI0035B59EAC
MERRLKLKSLKRVYSQRLQGSEKRDVGLRSPGAPKRTLGKSLSLDWRLPLGSTASESSTAGLHRIDELDLSSSQHLCRSATCPSVPHSDPFHTPRSLTPAPEDSVRGSPIPTLSLPSDSPATTPSTTRIIRPHEDPGPTTPGSIKRPNRCLRRTRSRPEGPAPSFGPRAAAVNAAAAASAASTKKSSTSSGGTTGGLSVGNTVGGTIKRYVSLLRSRSAVSHRERPVIGRISPGKRSLLYTCSLA